MLHRIVCYLGFDQQKNWTVKIGLYDYVYTDLKSKMETIQLWNARNLGTELPKPKDPLRFLRAGMMEREGRADTRASRIMLFY